MSQKKEELRDFPLNVILNNAQEKLLHEIFEIPNQVEKKRLMSIFQTSYSHFILSRFTYLESLYQAKNEDTSNVVQMREVTRAEMEENTQEENI